MQKIIFVIALFLYGCGGHEKENWEIDQELCEAQGGEAQLLSVANLDTGEEYLDIKCVYPKNRDQVWCKPGNPYDEPETECPEI